MLGRVRSVAYLLYVCLLERQDSSTAMMRTDEYLYMHGP